MSGAARAHVAPTVALRGAPGRADSDAIACAVHYSACAMTDAHARAKRLAELAGLTLRDGEIDALGRDLERILGYVGALAEVDTSGVAPLASPNEDAAVLRDDTPERTTSSDSVLASGPLTRDGAFVVPNVLE